MRGHVAYRSDAAEQFARAVLEDLDGASEKASNMTIEEQAKKLHERLLFAAPEMHLLHIKNALEDATDAENTRLLNIARAYADGCSAAVEEHGGSGAVTAESVALDMIEHLEGRD